MIESPKSLTAIVHVKFHYKEEEVKAVGERELVMMGEILDRASKLPPEQQDILAKFAHYLDQLGKETAENPT